MQRQDKEGSFLENLVEGTLCMADLAGEKIESNLGISRLNVVRATCTLGTADLLYGAYINLNPLYFITGCICLATAVKPSMILPYKTHDNSLQETITIKKAFNYGLLGITSYGLLNLVAGSYGILQASVTGDSELKSVSHNVLINGIVWLSLISGAYIHQTISEPNSKNV